MNNKKYVKIQSTMDIAVTSGLELLDVTNKDAHVPDRLKVQALWPKLTVMIKKGVGEYPANITDWATVKSLVKANILTIGGYTDEADKEVEKTTDELNRNMDEIKNKLKEIKTTKLSDIVEEV